MQNHDMKLYASPYEKIEARLKFYELRLFDEKRQKINLGDTITFTKLDEDGNETENHLSVKVTGLVRFRTFWELVTEIGYQKCGWDLEHMHPDKTLGEYYTKEQEAKHGVLGIKIELID